MTYDQERKNAELSFESAGIEDAAVDARLLMCHASGRDRTWILSHGGEEMPDEVREVYASMCERRRRREPLQLIMGYTSFMGLDFLVQKGVLIPRIDSECLVEEAMRYVEDGSRVLDVCTGSGCLLLSLMSYKNGIEGCGLDISDKALALAGENASRLGHDSRAVFLLGDMFEPVEGRTFDYIICNPPYVRRGDIEGLPEEVRLYDPKDALDGGEDGLDFYRTLADKACRYLEREGMMFLEIGWDEADQVRDILEESGYRNIEVIKDYSGRERVVVCLNASRT